MLGEPHQDLDHPQRAEQPRLVSASASGLCLTTSSSVRRLNSGFALSWSVFMPIVTGTILNSLISAKQVVC